MRPQGTFLVHVYITGAGLPNEYPCVPPDPNLFMTDPKNIHSYMTSLLSLRLKFGEWECLQ